MSTSTPLLRALVAGPKLVVSAAIVVVLAALLPAPLSWVVLTLVLVVLGGLAIDGMEGPAVRLLLRARPAVEAERRVVAEAMTHAYGATAPWTTVYVRRRHTTGQEDLELVGRRCIVVTPSFIKTVSLGLVPGVVADGLMTHAASRREVDGASAMWLRLATSPFSLVAALIRVPLGRARSAPLGAVAWRLRGVLLLGSLASTSCTPHGAAAVGAAVIIGLTYLVPFTERELARRRRGLSDVPGRSDSHAPGHDGSYRPTVRAVTPSEP